MKVRKISIATQILVILTIVSVIGVAALGASAYFRTSTFTLSQVRNNAMDLASVAAASVDAETFAAIDSQDAEAYEEVNDALSVIRENSSLEYVYSFRCDGNGEPYFVVDTDESEGASYGEAYEMDETMAQAFGGEIVADEEPTTDEWGTYISAYAPILQGQQVVGIVGVDVLYDDVLTQLNRIRVVVIGASVAVLAILFAAVFAVSKRVSKNLRILNAKVSELADGSGDLNKKIELRSGDELEVIAGNINDFIEGVGTLVHQVAVSSDSNNHTVLEMNSGVMELSANMEECSATSESVSEHLSFVTQQVVDLAHEVGEVNELVVTASANAVEAAELAKEHKTNALHQIEEINSGIIAALEEAKSIEKVGDISDQINDIALQTRILSINAQIEAARAGELGRGFSVVAMEISQLSDKTADAVNQIMDINLVVQQAMSNLRDYVERMNAFMTVDVAGDYKSFENLGEEYGESTDNIRRSMIILREQSEEISRLVESVDVSMHDISRAVMDSARQIETFSGSTGEIAQSMEQIMEMKLIAQSK